MSSDPDPGATAPRVRARRRRQPWVRPGRQPGVAPGRGQRAVLLLHDDVALHPDAIRELVEELYRSNAGIVGPKLVVVGRPADPPARRSRHRPVRRGRPVRRAGRDGSGAARRRAATSSSCPRPACSYGPTCSGRSGASIPASSSTETTSTCAGGPISAAPGCSSSPAGCATASDCRSAAPTCIIDALAARNRMQNVATLTGGGRPWSAQSSSSSSPCPDRRRPRHRPHRRGVVVAAHARRLAEVAGGARAPPVGQAAAPRARLARCSACQVRGSARLARYRRAHDTETYIGADTGRAPLAREPAQHDDRVGPRRRLRDRRQPHHDRLGRALGRASSCRCRRAPATGGRTSRRRGTRAGWGPRRRTRPGGACCRSPACCGSGAWASG